MPVWDGTQSVLERLRDGLIVSCQALPDSPVHGPDFQAAFARCAAAGGAVGIRANGSRDITAIRRVVDLPIIGIFKQPVGSFPYFITPDFAAAKAVVEAGADVVAVTAWERQRPDRAGLGELIDRIHDELGTPVMADVATAEDGFTAAALGADLVATTLSAARGYTRHDDVPDLALVARLSRSLPVPIVAEGQFWSPAQVQAAFRAGAYAVVVGTAITNPMAITRRFVRAVPQVCVRTSAAEM